jgi:hypothetical protein
MVDEREFRAETRKMADPSENREVVIGFVKTKRILVETFVQKNSNRVG